MERINYYNPMGTELQAQVRSSRQVTVERDNEGQRIDNFLRLHLKGVPKSHIYRILRRGEVRVNKGRIRQGYRLKEGDVVRIPPVRQAPEQPLPARGEAGLEGLEANILFEDSALLVLNKPSGMAVHGGSGMRFGVIEALRVLRPGTRFLELAHRLDRDTSGCLVIGKKRSALRHLHHLFREGGVTKHYVALVKGLWPTRAARVEVPLRRNLLRSGERMVRVAEDGKPAATLFEPLSTSELASLVRVAPMTGRTHQIRVHAAHAGHPVAADEKYGDKAFNRIMRQLGLRRLFLHSSSLTFPHPDSGEPLKLRAPVDTALKSVLKQAGLGTDEEL